MVELFVITIISILIFLCFKWRYKTRTTSRERDSVSERLNSEGIVGKSTFVLTTKKSFVPEPDLSGKMDIEVPLEYEPNIDSIEEQEELEQLGLPTEISSDITFEEMMEVVNEVESVEPQNPTKTGKLLYESENTDWVEQISSSSSAYQKRIVELIDLHLGEFWEKKSNIKPAGGVKEFDISDFINISIT